MANFLNVPQAADRLGVSIRMIRKLIAARQLPARKIGRCVRIAVAELERFESALPVR